MKVKTTRFGEIEIDQADIIVFPEGLPGFPDERDFVLIPYAEDSPFVYLQSATEDYLAFLMTDPYLFFDDYKFAIDDETMGELEIQDKNEVYVFAMVTVPKGNVKKMTANLVAPVIINTKRSRAKQMILEKSGYNTCHPVFRDGSSAEGSE